MNFDDYILFLDLETTGTDPERDLVLEVGWVFVEAKSLNTICSLERLTETPMPVHQIPMSPFVREMHRESGLLAAHRFSNLAKFNINEVFAECLESVRNELDSFRKTCIRYVAIFGVIAIFTPPLKHWVEAKTSVAALRK